MSGTDNSDNNILLSICIPTYNRGEFLDHVLKSIIEQDSFDQRVEIVVSDNCSTDNTPDVVKKYQKIYKNIIYHRNDSNILDRNFTKVLSLGNGEYLKLMNDSVILKSGVLNIFLHFLEQYRSEKPLVFFYNNTELHKNEIITCYNINQFIDSTSFYVGWTVNFGAWKIHFESLDDKERCFYLHFIQIDWSFRMLKTKDCLVNFGDWIEMQQLTSKGGYNIFEVHIDNYLFIFTPYRNSGNLSYRVFNREKKRLLKYFISEWIYLLIIRKDKRFNYITTGWKRILWRHYKFNPTLYLVLIKQKVRFFYHLINKT